jgi:hypothetical protein
VKIPEHELARARRILFQGDWIGDRIIDRQLAELDRLQSLQALQWRFPSLPLWEGRRHFAALSREHARLHDELVARLQGGSESREECDAWILAMELLDHAYQRDDYAKRHREQWAQPERGPEPPSWEWIEAERERLQYIEEQPTQVLCRAVIVHPTAAITPDQALPSVALKPAGQGDPATADDEPVPAELPAREQKPGGRPKGSTLYSDCTLFFYRVNLAYDRAKERGHRRPTPEHVYEALQVMEAEEVPNVIAFSPDTILRGLKHHMGDEAVWNDYRKLRAKGLKEPQ